jgi:hypothetical protein
MNIVQDNPLSLLQIKPTPRVSTPAQREAARANGRKSRGPTTIEGKLRSSRNSIRHGLLARRLAPPEDARGDAVLYRQIRAELIAEYDPASFMEQFTVDGLASDIVQLTRARQMTEALQRPMALAPEEMKKWREARDGRLDLKVIQRLSAALKSGDALSCKNKSARRLATHIATFTRSIWEYIHPSGDVTPEKRMSADDREELREVEEKWRVIEPIEKLLTDQDRLARVLTGAAPIRPMERRILGRVFGFIVQNTSAVIAGRATLEQRMAQAQRQTLLTLAQAPDNLLRLRRYTGQIESTIRRKLRALARG